MSRYTTTDVRSFSIFFLKEHNKLEPDCIYGLNSIVWSMCGEETGRIGYRVSTVSNDLHVELDYKTKSYDEDWRPIKYKIPLERVPCHFGGFRWYFRCPLSSNGQYCGRRVAILYKVSDYFGCRHCANLTYDSCNESKRFRGFPWKSVSDCWKGDEYYKKLKRTHYRGLPTRKFRRCLKLWGDETYVHEAEKQLYKEL